MGERTEILNALSKLTTGTILALILGFQIWNNSQNDQQWNQRLGGIMERQATSLERQEETSKILADALVRILEAKND